MSALTAASGEPQSVGDAGQLPPTAFLELIAATVDNVRALALYDLLRLRLVRPVFVAPPVAGAELSIAVPAGAIWELLSVRMRIVTSAVVANRVTTLTVTRAADSATYQRYTTLVNVAASTTADIEFSPGVGTSGFNAAVVGPLPSPPPVAQSGDTIATLTLGIDTADQYSQIAVTVREWSVGQVYWAADLIGRELGFEHLTDLPASTQLPEGTGQAIPVSPLAR